MTSIRPMLFPAADTHATALTTDRRGFLRGLVFLPLTAVAASILPPPAAAWLVREDPDLVRMGAEIESIEARLIDAIEEREKARKHCRAMWPELPQQMIYFRSEHSRFSYRLEMNEDNKPFCNSGQNPGRSILGLSDLQQCAVEDGRQSHVKLARKLLATVDRYETDRAIAIEGSGYGAAKRQVFWLSYKIEELSDAVSSSPCHTFSGLYCKAIALQAAIRAGDQVDEHIGFRAKMRHAEALARTIINLRTNAAMPRAPDPHQSEIIC